MPTIEGLRLKILKYRRKKYAKALNSQLNNHSFTIISNNCWGGMIYESYLLQKQSPTVGVFFMAEDYIRFLSDLKGYLASELVFISPEDSKWKSAPQVGGDKRFGSYPIGKIRDVEIFFLHEHSKEEAKKKWLRRIERINWDRLLIKFNDQNGCTLEHLEQFLQLPYKNKIFFTCKSWPVKAEEIIVIPQLFNKKQIMVSYEPFGRTKYADITRMINSL